MSNKPWVRWFATLAAGVLLGACGGGGSDSGTVSSSSESASGTITGFGSVIVEGKAYDDTGAAVFFSEDPTAPKSAALGDLRLGMRIDLVAATAGAGGEIVVGSSVVGRIESLSADGFLVAGQTIRIVATGDAPTAFEGAAGLADLAAGDFVEVHGDRDENGVIVATRVERKAPDTPFFVRVAGTVSGFDADAKHFEIAGLAIEYDDATRVVPGIDALADGVSVAVWSDVAPSGNLLQAKALRVRVAPAHADGDALRLGGLVRDLDFGAKTFTLRGMSVDASGASFVNGSANDLADGRRIGVAGTWLDGGLVATEVHFHHAQGDGDVALTGAITDYVGPASFKVRGVPVDASGGDVEFSGGDSSNLGLGVVVRIVGKVTGDVVIAAKVAFPDTPDGAARSLVGVVRDYDTATGSFSLFNAAMTLAADAQFMHADRSEATIDELGDGDHVRVRGSFDAGRFTVTEVVFLDGPSIVVDRFGGAVTQVDITTGRMRVNGMVVRFDENVNWQGDRDMLRNGAHIHVDGVAVGGELVARTVTIDGADDASRMRAIGTVSDFGGLASFSVAGQPIDASAADFVNGISSDLGDGDFVEVRGEVVDGVVHAAVVVFR